MFSKIYEVPKIRVYGEIPPPAEIEVATFGFLDSKIIQFIKKRKIIF